MITVVRREAEPTPLVWLDVVDPTPEELACLSRDYGLHPTLVADCLQPFHLPKYEQSGDVTFIIVRAFDENASVTETSVQALTRKIALFLGERFLITVHRKDQSFMVPIREKYSAAKAPMHLQVILLEILLASVETYHRLLEIAEQEAHAFESTVLSDHQDAAHWDAFFHTQARLTVTKRLFWHIRDAVLKFEPHASAILPIRQDLRERLESLQFFADTLLDDLRNLLAVQLGLVSHGTNKVMRTLTVFSVIFMPLTFIVGVYGMNFQHMPELGWRYGYAAILAVLGITAGALGIWFHKKGWL